MADLSFTARAGGPGSLTIEVDAASLLAQQNTPPDLRPQVNVPALAGDDKLLSIAWGLGWAVPITQRLIALGGNSRLQLLSFECPSLDSTDMAWGASGTIDAVTDPVTLQVMPFGASVYGRAFAVGDYIIWNNPAVVNGRYQYEIDQITALNQNTFTLARRGQGAARGTAAFGTVMAAQSGQFFQLLDPTLFALWDGTHQVFQFLWDGMIVSAVAASTAGLLQPVIQSLIPIPPAAAAMGLDLGAGSPAATSTMAPPPSTGTGGQPLGPGGGIPPGTPLPPSIPPVPTLPDPAASTVGQRVTFQGNVYIFTAPPSGMGNGYWAFDTTGSPSIRDTFQNLGLYPPANYALGTVFVAVDLTVAYAVQSVNGVKVWIYYNGIFQAPIASIPATLGIYDTGFTFRASDYLHSWIWSGTAWNFTTGGFPAGMQQSFASPAYLPSGALWHLLDGSTQPISQNDGTLVATVLATVANTYIVQ